MLFISQPQCCSVACSPWPLALVYPSFHTCVLLLRARVREQLAQPPTARRFFQEWEAGIGSKANAVQGVSN